MNRRWLLLSLVLAATSSHAANGLLVPPHDSLWPQWQARIQLQTSTLHGSGADTKQEIRGGALLGDYFLAQPSFGMFRATSGIVVGSLAGAPLYKALPGQALGMSVHSTGLQPMLQPMLQPAAEAQQALPYLGLGFNRAILGSAFSISADLGMVAQSPGSSIELGRALLGNQGVERAFRELRLSPMAQLSVRYSF